MLRGMARSMARSLRSLADRLDRMAEKPVKPEAISQIDDTAVPAAPRYLRTPQASLGGTATAERLSIAEQIKREREHGLTPHQESLITTLPPRGWLGFIGSFLWEILAFLSQSMVVWLVVITLVIGGITVSMVYKIVDGWNETLEILEKDINQP